MIGVGLPGARLTPGAAYDRGMADGPGAAVVVMAKAPVAGRVKTRLVRGGVSPQAAVAVHEAMLRCVLERVEATLPGRYVLAVTEPGHRWWASWRRWRVFEQRGAGLGERMGAAWADAGGGGAVFLGVDCPDFPADGLRRAWAVAGGDGADVAVGPVEDGGYWTLAAGRPVPAVLRGIDWGTPHVYDQTRAAAAAAGLSMAVLPRWRDVDEPADLAALRRRLEEADGGPLTRLRRALQTLDHEATHV